jgi:hypothetical protein
LLEIKKLRSIFLTYEIFNIRNENMKKILLVVLMVGVLLAPACEGPEGPQGPPGFDGQDGKDGKDGTDGIDIIDLVFEVEVDFTAENNFSAVFDFGEEGVFADDGFLIFRRFGITQNNRSIWRLLPQTIFLENGVLVYNYEFTNQIVAIFVDGAVDPATLGAQFTQDQYFRIVYMPGLFANGQGARVDYSDFDAVMKMLGKTEQDIVKLKNQ